MSDNVVELTQAAPVPKVAETNETPVAPAPTPEPSNLFPLDDKEVIVTVHRDKAQLKHRLRRATADELQKRFDKIEYEIEDVSDEEVTQNYEDQSGDVYIYDTIAQDVTGYAAGSAGDGKSPIPVDSVVAELNVPLKDLLPIGDKVAAVKRYFTSSEAVLERDKKAVVFDLLGASVLRVVQTIAGGKSYTHILRQPTEEEWQRYNRRIQRRLETKGARRRQEKIKTSIHASIELYDAIVLRLEGVSLGQVGWNDQQRKQFIAAVDPWHKRQVIQEVVNNYAPALGD
jgi:hypothetical protein